MNARLITAAPTVEYPDSDGKPMAENTKQYEWIVTIKGNLDIVFRGEPEVFVAGDNLIYAREGDVRARQAPDVYVAFGRPKGHRGSYKVWEEGGIFPQVVFEILSPGNRGPEMARKFKFYEKYGAEEYYVYDPDTNELSGWLRGNGELAEIPKMNGFVSPRLGVRFETTDPEVTIYRPDGHRFLTFDELAEMEEAARTEAQAARTEADAARAEADAARAEADRLRAKLRAAGIDPDAA